MSKHEVIYPFRDLEDKKATFPDGRVYQVGDKFPATKEMERKVTDERIEELSSNKNKIGKPLIKEVGE